MIKSFPHVGVNNKSLKISEYIYSINRLSMFPFSVSFRILWKKAFTTITRIHEACHFPCPKSDAMSGRSEKISCILAYIWLIFMVNVGKYTINACYGILKKNDWRCLSSWFVLHRLWYITSWNKKTDVSILFHAFQAKLILWLFVAVLWKDGSIL